MNGDWLVKNRRRKATEEIRPVISRRNSCPFAAKLGQSTRSGAIYLLSLSCVLKSPSTKNHPWLGKFSPPSTRERVRFFGDDSCSSVILTVRVSVDCNFSVVESTEQFSVDVLRKLQNVVRLADVFTRVRTRRSRDTQYYIPASGRL